MPLMLLTLLPTLAVMSAVGFAPMKVMKADKGKSGGKKATKAAGKGAEKASGATCKGVLGKLKYQAASAKTDADKTAAEDRLQKYRSMTNAHKTEFAELFDKNNGSVSWMADYLEKHSSYNREAEKFVEGMMTRSFI